MNRLHYFFHLLIYYISWTVCILLAAKGKGLFGAFLVMLFFLIQFFWQWKVRKQIHGLFTLILILTITGSFIDSLLTKSGLIIFKSNPFAPYFTPPWMVAIWMSFALLIFATLSDLLTHYILVGCLAFLGFAIAYALGSKMGAAIFPYGYKTSILIGLIWAIMLPVCFYAYQGIINQHD